MNKLSAAYCHHSQSKARIASVLHTWKVAESFNNGTNQSAKFAVAVFSDSTLNLSFPCFKYLTLKHYQFQAKASLSVVNSRSRDSGPIFRCVGFSGSLRTPWHSREEIMIIIQYRLFSFGMPQYLFRVCDLIFIETRLHVYELDIWNSKRVLEIEYSVRIMIFIGARARPGQSNHSNTCFMHLRSAQTFRIINLKLNNNEDGDKTP